MKKTMVAMLLAAMLMTAACGGGGSSSGDTAANNSIDAFLALFDYFEANFATACTEGSTSSTCVCPGGGTVVLPNSFIDAVSASLSVAATKDVATASNCIDASGNIFNGTVESDDGITATITFAPFAECSSVSGTVGLEACSGSVTATCGGQTLTCTVVDAGGDECDCQ